MINIFGDFLEGFAKEVDIERDPGLCPLAPAQRGGSLSSRPAAWGRHSSRDKA